MATLSKSWKFDRATVLPCWTKYLETIKSDGLIGESGSTSGKTKHGHNQATVATVLNDSLCFDAWLLWPGSIRAWSVLCEHCASFGPTRRPIVAHHASKGWGI